MKPEEIASELQEVARQLGVTIRYEKGDFEGGYCILKAEKVLIVNKRLTPQRKSAVLALALHDIGLDTVFVKPVLRQYIEDEVARAGRITR
jgi:hypothetical protein